MHLIVESFTKSAVVSVILFSNKHNLNFSVAYEKPLVCWLKKHKWHLFIEINKYLSSVTNNLENRKYCKKNGT